MNVPHRHHHVPRFLLKDFASYSNVKIPHVWMFRRGLNAPKEISINNVGVEKNFHGVATESNLEFEISKHESQFAKLIEGLREREIEITDLPLLREYVVHLIIRTKNVRSGLANATETFLAKIHDAIPSADRKKWKLRAKKALRQRLRESEVSNFIKQLPRSKRKAARTKIQAELSKVDFRQVMATFWGAFRENLDINEMSSKAHIDALSKSVTPTQRIESISRLCWRRLYSPPGTWVLGDVVVLGAFVGLKGFRSLINAAASIEQVITPISDRVCLIGSSLTSVPEANPEEINLAMAELSRDFLVASRKTDRELNYSRHIGLRAELISEEEFSEIISDIL